MMLRRTLTLVPALLLAVTLASCGSDGGESDDAGPSSSATPTGAGSEPTSESTESVPPETSEAPTTIEPDLSTPSEPGGITTAPAPDESIPSADPPDVEVAGVWEKELASLIDTSVPAAERAARIIRGKGLVTTIGKVDRALAGYGAELEVTATELAGSKGFATVSIASGGQSFGMVKKVVFLAVGDGYRLTRPGACKLAAVAGVSCP